MSRTVSEPRVSALSRRHPLNTVAPYYTMFRPEFPLAALEDARGWVLDPFCGRGTTNFAARLLGLPSVGVDASPVAAAIASAKLVSVGPEHVVGLARELAAGEPTAVPQGEFWELAYHPQTLRELCAVREGVLKASSDGPQAAVLLALRAIMLGALHGPRGKHTQSYLSNQMPRTYATKPEGAVRFWRARDMRPTYVSLIDVVHRRAERAFDGSLPDVDGAIILGDSRSVEVPDCFGPFTHVVTSPPYYGMRTYLSDQWLRHWFLGGPDRPDYPADRQLDTSNPQAFACDLARVWDNVARHAAPGCRLSIRFGAVPSVPSDPESLILESLACGAAEWVVESVTDAGAADNGRRQAAQFGFVRSKPITEIDVVATLRG